MHDERVIPKGVESIITVLCADYFRRAAVISDRTAPYNVIMEYRFLNYRIMNATLEVVGEKDAAEIIYDIGSKRGYAKSSCLISERSYKVKKEEVKRKIARRLCLW